MNRRLLLNELEAIRTLTSKGWWASAGARLDRLIAELEREQTLAEYVLDVVGADQVERDPQ